MEKIYILILLAFLQDAFTHPQVIRTKRKPVNYEHKCETETTTEQLPGITGGTEVTLNEFPHLAAIGYWVNQKIEWWCGGTLINKRFVLTAAHCLEDKESGNAKAVYVRLGDINLKDASDDANVQQIEIMKRIPHPDYKYPKKYNDIALLKLKKDAIFNDFVKPACFHRTYNIMQTQATVVGWGLKEFVEPGQKPYKVVIDLHHIDTCRKLVNKWSEHQQYSFLPENLRDDSMICAGVLAGGKDSCTGDSGGPLQVNYCSRKCSVDVIGLVSFGLNGCGRVNTPAVYVRVSHYVPWIERVINSSY